MASGSSNCQPIADQDGEAKPQNGHSDNKPTRQEIATYVFLDLEATSLLDGGQKPRIVELCLLAVHRADLQHASLQGSTPRVMNKLTLCFDPAKPMSYCASEITGLYNDSLENQNRLSNKTANLMHAFIDHLAKPVCLIAHNGNRFDFPLLKAEFKRIKEEFSDDILCVDSLEAFRSLDGLPARHEMSANQNQGSTPKSTEIIWNQPPGFKRKAEGNDSMETNIKQVKRNTNQFDVNFPTANTTKINADKVKKKLFSDEESLNKNTSATNFQKDVDKVLNKDPTEQLCEFSASIEDDVLLSILEDVENQSGETTSDTESTQEPTESDLDSMKVEKAKLAVETGTGYIVCQKEEKAAANEKTSIEQGETLSAESPQQQQSSSLQQSSSSSSSQQLLSTLETLSQSQSPISSPIQSSPSLLQTSSRAPACQPSVVTPTTLTKSASATDQTSSSSTHPLKSGNSPQSPTCTRSVVSPFTPGPSTSVSSSHHTLQSVAHQSPRVSYKLEQIYIRKFGCRPNASHCAEDDCVALLKISCRTSKFVEWLDDNAVNLSSIESAY